MRWEIVKTKRKIASTDFKNHIDDIEMSGEKISLLVTYGDSNDKLVIKRILMFPLIRIQPDVTQSSYRVDNDSDIISFNNEKLDRVEIDGILSVFSHTKELKITHRFYPSTKNQIAYEQIDLENVSKKIVKLNYEDSIRIDSRLTCKGYAYVERFVDKNIHLMNPNEKLSLIFAYEARYANEKLIKETNPLASRRKRVNELLSECDLTTGNQVIDTLFAFSKIRAGESIFNTSAGKIHSPGGTNYYAAIWCNDEEEYSTPWFGFTNDKNEVEAAKNAMHWFEPYMNDEFLPIPSSIISEATDYWNGAGDRGDASMFLYGNTRFFLTRKETPTKKELDMLAWAATYIERNINEDDVVFSNTDELEGRISSGINLATSSLSYGAFGLYATLLQRLGKPNLAKKYLKLQQRIKNGLLNYFAGNVSGYDTFHYHKGLEVIRAWNCLPAYMGIKEKSKESLKAILEKLWKNGGCISTENEETMWDRSALYFLATLFKNDMQDEAFDKLIELSTSRLLGERVPYVVEAYPEQNMRHLSGESALYCRIITDGLLNVGFNEKGVTFNPKLPKGINSITIKNIYLDGKYRNLRVGKTKVTYEK